MTPIFMRIWLMKITQVLDLLMGRYELSKRLAHQPRLDAHVGIAHLSFDFGLGNQGGHRVDHDDVDGVAPDQDFRDLQCLFPVVRLADQEVFDLDTQLCGRR